MKLYDEINYYSLDIYFILIINKARTIKSTIYVLSYSLAFDIPKRTTRFASNKYFLALIFKESKPLK